MSAQASNPTSSAAFALFGETADKVAATSSRLEKAAILAAFFDTLSDTDLAIAARYLAGYLFPLRDQRTTSVGGSAVVGALKEITGATDDILGPRFVALGDAGDVAAELFASHSPEGEPLTIQSVADAVDTLAGAQGSLKKRALVTQFLRRAGSLEAKYLVKLLLGDLRIGLQEGAVEDAVARWAGVPVAQVQWTNMLLGDIGETAVLARHGRLGEARMRLFHPIKFMLATPAADLADVARQMPAEFVVEDKYDGIRAQAHIAREAPLLSKEGLGVVPEATHGIVHDNVRVALFSRTLDEITRGYPDLIPSLAALAHTAAGSGGLILDGEIVPIQGDVVLPFQELQKRLGRKVLTDAMLAEVPAAFMAYDCIYANDRVLIDEPFRLRREILSTLSGSQERAGERSTDSSVLVNPTAFRIAPSHHFTDAAALDQEFADARGRGNEGLMVKDPESTYKPGRRGREWLKIKRALATLDCVVTSVEVGHGGRRHLLSDYTFAVRASETDGTLVTVGKAYSGLTDAELERLSVWFRAHTIQEFAHGRVRVVEPKIVVEVAFDRIQPSNRHKSGYSMRFPRIARLREDKSAADIDILATVKRLAGEVE